MNGGQLVALVVCLAVMVAANVWVHVGPTRWQPVTGPVAAAAAAARRAGRRACRGRSSASGRGRWLPGLLWGGAAVACVPLVYAVGLAVPATRGLFRDARHRVGARSTLHRAGLVVPLGTVVFEEVAFRGVLWGLFEVAHGALWATGVSAVLFGFWHVLPAVDGARAELADRSGGRAPTSCARWPARCCSRRWPVSCSGCCATGAGACSRPGCCTGRPTGWASSPPRWRGGGRRRDGPRRVSRTRGGGRGSRARPARSTRSVLLEHLPARLFALPDGLDHPGQLLGGRRAGRRPR